MSAFRKTQYCDCERCQAAQHASFLFLCEVTMAAMVAALLASVFLV